MFDPTLKNEMHNPLWDGYDTLYRPLGVIRKKPKSMTDKEKEEFKNAFYHNYSDRCLKKTKLNIIANPSGFGRGIPQQLANDMYILAMDNIEKSRIKKL